MPRKIDSANRAEFEQLGVHAVRERVEASNYVEPKVSQAWAWLDEQEHGKERAHSRATLARSNLALLISILALVVSIMANVINFLRS